MPAGGTAVLRPAARRLKKTAEKRSAAIGGKPRIADGRIDIGATDGSALFPGENALAGLLATFATFSAFAPFPAGAGVSLKTVISGRHQCLRRWP